MNSANTNLLHRNATRRRLPVGWSERPGASSSFSLQPLAFSLSHRAFTILELLLVVGIIGLMAALALPHLGGMTKGNALTAATRQLLDDVTLARQRAQVNRAEVCMVFLPANFWTNDTTNLTYGGGGIWTNQQINSLYSHQCSAYALIALRSVGDQPGKSNVHYLINGTWRTLPQGIYISPFQFTNTPYSSTATNWISTTNTTTGLTNNWPVTPFPTNILFPFPSTYVLNSNILPYICFTPSGRLTTNTDQFISLTSGGVFYALNPDGSPAMTTSPGTFNLVETPPGNASNNANLIHIDWLTGRAKIERNQF